MLDASEDHVTIFPIVFLIYFIIGIITKAFKQYWKSLYTALFNNVEIWLYQLSSCLCNLHTLANSDWVIVLTDTILAAIFPVNFG